MDNDVITLEECMSRLDIIRNELVPNSRDHFALSAGIAALHEMERGHTVNRWVSCDERLPEQSEDGQPPGVRCSDCVMITDGRLIHMAYCVNDEWQYADCGQVSDFVDYVVTHWMPLPETPKETDENG